MSLKQDIQNRSYLPKNITKSAFSTNIFLCFLVYYDFKLQTLKIFRQFANFHRSRLYIKELNSYRPISVISPIEKLFEALKQLVNILNLIKFYVIINMDSETLNNMITNQKTIQRQCFTKQLSENKFNKCNRQSCWINNLNK